jgi:hypothetical protein
MPFEYPIEIKAYSYPLHFNEEFTIQSKEKLWEGNTVNLYYIEYNQSNITELMYKHELPSDNKLIGAAEIKQGIFNFQWKVPRNAIKKEDWCFYIAAKSDKGIISGVMVETLAYKGFKISPKNVNIGQTVKYTIAGFSWGCTFEVYLLQVKPGIIPGERISTLGIFKKTNGSISSSFKLPKTIENTSILPGQYIIEAIIIPKDENTHPRQVVYAYINVK